MYEEMILQAQQANYSQHKDRYVGQIDPVTKQRHGQGVYTYTGENPFFQYQGQWSQGVQQTDISQNQLSVLVMRDGSKYCGEFLNGQITGYGVKLWASGQMYQGQFQDGEMHGQGKLSYNTKPYKQQDALYEGSFLLNSREGHGVLTKKNNDIYMGNFRNNQPNGDFELYFHTGTHYKGPLVNGIMQGENGFLSYPDRKCFRGEFKDGLLDGEGEFFIQESSYSLKGTFSRGKATLLANKFLFKIKSPSVPEDDPNAKKDPKKPAQVVEEDFGSNKVKITIDVTNPNEANRVLAFNLEIVFQGEPYEDPNPPEEEDPKAKKKPAGKEAEPEIRLITPPPVILEKEDGRTFEFILGRFENVVINRDESQKTLSSQEQVPTEPQTIEQWVEYKVDQTQENNRIVKSTSGGLLSLSDLKFKFDEQFKSGVYELQIKDITDGIPEEDKLGLMKVDLKIRDSEADAEYEAQQAALKKAGGKK